MRIKWGRSDGNHDLVEGGRGGGGGEGGGGGGGNSPESERETISV